MEELIAKELASRLKEIETIVLIVLFVLYTARKEYRMILDKKSQKNIQYKIKDNLAILTNGYSNTLSKDTAVLVYKLVFSFTFNKLFDKIVEIRNSTKSQSQFNDKFRNNISIIGDEQNQILSKFKYNGTELSNIVEREILNTEILLNDTSNIDLRDNVEVKDTLETRMTLFYNDTIEKL